LVSTSVVRQKVDLRRTFYFDTQIHPEVRGFINLFSICACSPARFGTVRAKWKTDLGADHPGRGAENSQKKIRAKKNAWKKIRAAITSEKKSRASKRQSANSLEKKFLQRLNA
jgi:hypothetical protein